MSMQDVPKKLKALRKYSHMNQGEVAKILGVSRTTYHTIEKGN